MNAIASPRRKPTLRRISQRTKVTLPPPPRLPVLRGVPNLATDASAPPAEDGLPTLVRRSEIRELSPSGVDLEDRVQTLIAFREAPLPVVSPEREDESLSALVDVYEDRAATPTVRPPPPARCAAVLLPAVVLPAELVHAKAVETRAAEPATAEPTIAEATTAEATTAEATTAEPAIVAPRIEEPSRCAALLLPAVVPPVARRESVVDASSDTTRWYDEVGLPARVAFVVSCAALASLVTTLLTN